MTLSEPPLFVNVVPRVSAAFRQGLRPYSLVDGEIVLPIGVGKGGAARRGSRLASLAGLTLTAPRLAAGDDLGSLAQGLVVVGALHVDAPGGVAPEAAANRRPRPVGRRRAPVVRRTRTSH